MKPIGKPLACLGLAWCGLAAHAQTLSDTTAATGVAAELSKRGAANGIGALNRVRSILKGSNVGAPAGSPTAKGAPAGRSAAAASRKPATPLLWRLKGTVASSGGGVGVFEGLSGGTLIVRAGTMLAEGIELVKIEPNRATLRIDGKTVVVNPS